MHFCPIVYSPALQYANACWRFPHPIHRFQVAACRLCSVALARFRVVLFALICAHEYTNTQMSCNFREYVVNIKTPCSVSKCMGEWCCFCCRRLRERKNINSLGKCCYAYASFDWLTASMMYAGMSISVCCSYSFADIKLV